MQLACPACQTVHNVDPKFAGQHVRCTQCATDFMVPHEAPASGEGAAPPPGASAPSQAQPHGAGAGPTPRSPDAVLQQPSAHGAGPVGAAGPQKTSALAVIGFILSIVGLLGSWCCCTLILIIPGVVLGIVALVQIKNSGGRLTGRGLAITAIILGVVALILLIILQILSAAFQPELQHWLEVLQRSM